MKTKKAPESVSPNIVGSSVGTRRLRLTARDLDLLKFIGREKGATAEVLQRRFYPRQKRDALKSTLRRYSSGRSGRALVASEPLDDRRVYYRLTPEGARLVGAPVHAAHPLGPDAKVRLYAESWYLYVQQPGKRTRLDLRMLREDFGLIGQRLSRHAFFLDETRRESRLGCILVDHRASVRHTVTKTVDALNKLLDRGCFSQIIGQGRFVVTVLTGKLEAKRAIDSVLATAVIDRLGGKLLKTVQRPQEGLPVKLDVSVVPGLLALLPVEDAGTNQEAV